MWIPEIEKYDEIIKSIKRAEIDREKSEERLQIENIYDDIVKCLEIIKGDLSTKWQNLLNEEIETLKKDIEEYKYGKIN